MVRLAGLSAAALAGGPAAAAPGLGPPARRAAACDEQSLEYSFGVIGDFKMYSGKSRNSKL